MIKKPALTTTRAALELAGIALGDSQALLDIPHTFWNLPTVVSDRATCETDPSLQQLLPYITLVNEDFKYFVYGRGAKSGEQRLVGKLSLGLGGHVDTENPGDLLRHLVEEARRELAEEAALADVTFNFRRLISDQLPDGNVVPVGSVHLGIWGIASVDSSDLGQLEDGIITNGEWMTVEELGANFLRFENWSQIIIRELQDNAESY